MHFRFGKPARRFGRLIHDKKIGSALPALPIPLRPDAVLNY
jgi:hypothetical protein